MKRLEGRLEGVDFLNVTDCALARMKLAALPFASILKQRFGCEPLVNVSCRDRNLIAIQADLLAAWATGIRSIVALTGDAVTVGDSPDRKGVFEVNSLGLLHAVATLNSGKDLAGNELKGAPQFFPGVVVNPNARNAGAEIRRLKKKKESGARYALSQPVFDVEAAVAFLREAEQAEVPIFLGLLPLKNGKAAQGIANIPGIRLSEAMVSMMNEAGDKDLSRFFLDHCLEVAEAAKPYVCGYHVVSGVTPLLAIELLEELKGLVRK
jgi:5,10-methylenetetrahydrofolate reductase